MIGDKTYGCVKESDGARYISDISSFPKVTNVDFRD